MGKRLIPRDFAECNPHADRGRVLCSLPKGMMSTASDDSIRSSSTRFLALGSPASTTRRTRRPAALAALLTLVLAASAAVAIRADPARRARRSCRATSTPHRAPPPDGAHGAPLRAPSARSANASPPRPGSSSACASPACATIARSTRARPCVVISTAHDRRGRSLRAARSGRDRRARVRAPRRTDPGDRPARARAYAWQRRERDSGAASSRRSAPSTPADGCARSRARRRVTSATAEDETEPN